MNHSILTFEFDGLNPPETCPSVSLCMIVKNEADNLADCLTSVGDFPTEIIIVDTGSTDSTVEIARSFGARVEHFTWIDDFAAARNESIKYATGDWVFWLDADDRVPPESVGKLKQAVASGRTDAYRCRMVSPLTDDPNPAVSQVYYTSLFRNRRGVQFEDPIHETPTESILRLGLTVANTNIVVHHTGYSGDPAMLRAKSARNVKILRQCIDREPDKAKWRYQLGVSLYQMADYAGAIDALSSIVAQPAPQLNPDTQLYKAHLLLSSAYTVTGQPAQAEAVLQQAAGRFAYRPHLWIATGIFYLSQQQPEAAVKALEHARSLPPSGDAEGERWQPGVLEMHLGQAYHQLALQYVQAQNFLEAALNLQQELELGRPQQSEAYKLLALCLNNLGQAEAAMTAWQLAGALT
jgi:Tfp pilus assembly protein PilF